MKSMIYFALFCLATTALIGTGHAQATWSSAGASTPLLTGHAVAYHPDVSGRALTVMFGGKDGNGVASNSTYTFDGTSWSPPRVGGPAPRSDHAMAYSPVRNAIVMHGGRAADGTILDDTWEWHGTWRRMNLILPPALADHAMMFDGQQMILQGGVGPRNSMNGRTYLYRTVGQNLYLWANYPLTVFNMPSPRAEHAMAYDSVRQKLVLFGGRDARNRTNNEVWEWDGFANPASLGWVRVNPNPQIMPTPRQGHSMVFDAAVCKVVLYGSDTARDTWEWDGTTWTSRPFAGRPPLANLGSGLAYHAESSFTIYVSGGVGTYKYSRPVPALSSNFGFSGCPFSTGEVAVMGTKSDCDLLWINSTMTFQVQGMPLSRREIAFILFGFDPQNQAISLTAIGAPRCWLLVSPVVAAFSLVKNVGASTVDLPLTLQNDASLVGLNLYCQAAITDGGVGANPLGLVTSNGLKLTVGR